MSREKLYIVIVKINWEHFEFKSKCLKFTYWLYFDVLMNYFVSLFNTTRISTLYVRRYKSI